MDIKLSLRAEGSRPDQAEDGSWGGKNSVPHTGILAFTLFSDSSPVCTHCTHTKHDP